MKNNASVKKRSRLLTATVVVILFSGYGCRSKTPSYEPTYIANAASTKMLLFGVPNQPFYDATTEFVNYLNQQLTGMQVQRVAGFTFGEYLKELSKQQFDFTIISGLQALESERNGYTIAGQGAYDSSYRGIIVVNKDSAIHDLSGLKKRTIATVGKPALAGHMLQVVFLKKNGINVKDDIRFVYFGSFETAIMNVYLGKCAAAFCSLSSWNNYLQRRPEIAKKLALQWQTPPTMNIALLLKNDLPKQTAEQLKKIMFSMHMRERGKKALAAIGCAALLPADSNSYLPLKTILKEYEAALP